MRKMRSCPGAHRFVFEKITGLYVCERCFFCDYFRRRY